MPAISMEVLAAAKDLLHNSLFASKRGMGSIRDFTAPFLASSSLPSMYLEVPGAAKDLLPHFLSASKRGMRIIRVFITSFLASSSLPSMDLEVPGAAKDLLHHFLSASKRGMGSIRVFITPLAAKYFSVANSPTVKPIFEWSGCPLLIYNSPVLGVGMLGLKLLFWSYGGAGEAGKMMKAPGMPGVMFLMSVFEGDPEGSFRGLLDVGMLGLNLLFWWYGGAGGAGEAGKMMKAPGMPGVMILMSVFEGLILLFCLYSGAGGAGVAGKMMKAPGMPGVMILRSVFEGDPKGYFRELRAL